MKPFTLAMAAAIVAMLVGTPDARSPRVLVVATPGPVQVEQPWHADEETEPGTTPGRVVTGRVRAPDGTAVAGALVALSRPREERAPGSPPADERERLEVIALTDGRGRFALPDVDPGRHLVTASVAGFAPGRGEVTVGTGATLFVDVSLGRGEAAFAISGQIRQTDGHPVTNALVRAVRPEGTTVAFSSAEGGFDLWLEAGHHVLWISAPGYAPQRRDAFVHAAQTLDVRLFPAASISGTVVGIAPGATVDQATPAPRAMVYAAPAELEGRPLRVRADWRGRFAFADLEPGRYVVWARQGASVGFHSGPVTLALGENANNVDVSLLRAAILTGRILDGRGAPVAGAQVQLLPSGKTDLGFGSGHLATLSDRDGRYTVAGVWAGRYRLRAEAAGRAPGELRDVAVFERDTRNVDVRLGAATSVATRAREARPAFIHGHVRWHDGAPAAGARVHWLPSSRGARDSVAVVAADGSYQLGPLPATAGRCLAAYPGDPVFTPTSPLPWGLGRGRQQRGGIDLAPGQLRTDVDLVLLRDDQTIAGQVRDPQGRPMAGALVWASQVPGAHWNENESGRPRVVSDRAGRFVINGVPAGEYEVRAMHPRFALARKPGVIAGSEAVEVAFVPPTWISGQVTDAGGGPVGPVRIAAVAALAPGSTTQTVINDANGLHAIFQAPPGARSGNFTLGPLPPGDYHLQVRGAAGSGLVSGIELQPSQWRQDVRVTVGAASTARADDGAAAR
jgi:hypothetical protein